MTEQGPVLVLTRPERQSYAFLAECKSRLDRDIQAVVSPIMRIVPQESDLDLDRFATLIVTSQNAIEQLGLPMTCRRVLTVGEKTAEYVRALGAQADCVGETVDNFIEHVQDIEGPAVHLRGVHTRGDLAARLTKRGIPVEECVVYDQVPQPMTQAALSALASGNAVVPVFSPRSAQLVSRHPAHPDTRVFAISRAAARAWTADGRIAVSQRPDRAAMLDLVVSAF